MIVSDKRNYAFFTLAIIAGIFSIYAYALQLGDGTKEDSLVFKKVMDDVKDVSLFSYNTFAVKNDGTLWGTGLNVQGWLGLDRPLKIHSFVKLMDGVKSVSGTQVIKEDGTLWIIDSTPKKVDDNVIKVSGRFYIKSDLSLWIRGREHYGEFGDGMQDSVYAKPFKIMDSIIDVCDCGVYSMIVTAENVLMVAGAHYLPSPFKRPSYEFIKAAERVSGILDGFYITTDGSLYAFGFSAEGGLGVGDIKNDILPTKIMDKVKFVSGAQICSFIITQDNSLYGCGGRSPNYFGALGTGSLSPELYPVFIMKNVKTAVAGSFHSAIIKEDGTLWTCGANDEHGVM